MINTILMDIEVQRDFFQRRGSLYRPQARDIARKIIALFDWAAAEDIPVLSTVLRLRPHEKGTLADGPYCIEGTAGEMKLPGTILPRWINLGLRNSTDLPIDLFSQYQQVIVEKRDTDIFAHARLERMITELPLCTFVICGAGLAAGIAQAAIGLRSRGFGVIVASDAILALEGDAAKMAEARMDAKGAVFASTSEIIVPTPARRLLTPFRTSVPVRK